MTPLRQRMLEDMGIRNCSENTQSSYVTQVSSFAKHFAQSPELLGPEEIRAWQVHLLNVKKQTPESICIAAAALRFLYKVTLKREWALEKISIPNRPHRLPVILSREEIAHFFECIGNLKYRTMLMTAYAGGLRISEVIHLKVDDIDSQRMVLRIDQGKGNRDGGRKNEWVVYAKPPFGGPKQVLDYLGRYTHRVAISNNRLLGIDDGKIRFRWKDYRHGSANGVMTLDADEFIRRFLLHVVPTGFMRIRHYGFLANRHCEAKLIRCRQLLGVPAPIAPVSVAPAEGSRDSGQDYRDRYEQLTGNSLRACPHCKKGRMVCIDVFAPGVLPRAPPCLEAYDARTF